MTSLSRPRRTRPRLGYVNPAMVNGCAIYRFGNGPTLVCLPGFTDTVHSWQPLIDALCDRVEIALVELPGLGHPVPGPSPATMDGLATLTAQVVWQSWVTPITMLGHSLGSALAVRAAHRLAPQCRAIISIEGNLTAADAFFTGQAAAFDDAHAFKHSLTAQVQDLAADGQAPASFADSVAAADPHTMWTVGRDVACQSAGDQLGQEFLAAPCPSVYVWSAATTSAASQDFLHHHQIPHHQLDIGHHWPWLTHPELVADLIFRAMPFARE